MNLGIDVHQSADGTFRTTGLSSIGLNEIGAFVGNEDLGPGVIAFLRHFAAVSASNPGGLPTGQTFWYGFWPVRFEWTAQILLAGEATFALDRFVPEIDKTIDWWTRQREICARAGAPFLPPRSDQTAMVSPGIQEGAPASGRRYTGADAMSSGWLLVTEEYHRGVVTTTHPVHLVHLAEHRPDLIAILAMPPGSNFDQGPDGNRVWLEE